MGVQAPDLHRLSLTPPPSIPPHKGEGRSSLPHNQILRSSLQDKVFKRDTCAIRSAKASMADHRLPLDILGHVADAGQHDEFGARHIPRERPAVQIASRPRCPHRRRSRSRACGFPRSGGFARSTAAYSTATSRPLARIVSGRNASRRSALSGKSPGPPVAQSFPLTTGLKIRSARDVAMVAVRPAEGGSGEAVIPGDVAPGPWVGGARQEAGCRRSHPCGRAP